MRKAEALMTVVALMVCCASWAGDPKIDLSVTNPAIQKLDARMKERAAKIEPWQARGAVGEELTGLLKQLNVPAAGLAEKKEVRDLVVAENEDRQALFRELALANGLQAKDLDAVAAAFAAMKRQTAPPAALVQDPASKLWVKKQDLKR